ncbi:MAG: hypothetical protein FD170_2115 [Bacteroidetes bacterium]|nr:MAG: hypothetical protein FD170_2115 [Bacteroidota bacterium]
MTTKTLSKYFFKALLFALPVLIYVVFIIVVDPYNFIGLFKVIDDKDKFRVVQRTDESSPRGNILWKTVAFKKNPTPNIIIGDSQGKDIDVSIIKKNTGEDYFNFCAPGASFTTIFKTFWFAAEQTRLEKVCFQLAFMNYNLEREYDLWHFAGNYFKRPYEYFTTKEIFFDAVANVAWAVTRDKRIVSRSYEFLPPGEMEELAQFRLDLFFSKYSYPEPYKDELRKIVKYCDENNIEYSFLILPVYKGVDEHLAKNNLFDDKLKFKEDIYSMGYTYDLDKLSGLKKDRFNFIDYFHPTQKVMDSLTGIVWAADTTKLQAIN